MKIVIAPDSFKGSLTAVEAAAAMAAGARRVHGHTHDIVSIPLADGGEGTVYAWIRACGGQLQPCTVTGPLGDPIGASYGLLDDGSAVVETAAAGGLTLVPPHLRNPLQTTTYGTGELIRHAILAGAPLSGGEGPGERYGCRRLIIGLGGSATNDGGAGALQALGVLFRSIDGGVLPAPITGGMLANIASIDRTNALDIAGLDVVLASDVMNPLTGPTGASAVYGPQKGATPDMVKHLDDALARYADLLKRDWGIDDVADIPGAGAAGGLGAALMAFFGARSQSGIDLLLDRAHFDDALVDSTYVITGEGSIDRQTLHGKAVMGVVKRCRGKVKVIAIGGIVDQTAVDDLHAAGIDTVVQASPSWMPVEEAMSRAAELVEEAAAQALSGPGFIGLK